MTELGVEAGPKSQTSFIAASENDGENRQVALDADFSALPLVTRSMDGEKVALEETLAPVPSTAPAIQALHRPEVELCSSAVAIPYAETTTPHTEHDRTLDHDFVTPADLKESANSAPGETPAFVHEKCMPSKPVCENMLTVTHDNGRPCTHAELECDAKEVNMVAHGSPRAGAVPRVEAMSNSAMIAMSMVDSVTDNLVNVSIQHAMNSGGEHLHNEFGKSSENGKGSYSCNEEECKGGPPEKISLDDKPTHHSARIDEMLVESSRDNDLMCSIKDPSTLDSNSDASGDNDCDNEADDGSVMEEDEDDLNERVEQESEGSDSSSSTSTLSFSSSGDDEEVGHFRFMKNLKQKLEMEAESECEEGELKEFPSQIKKTSIKKKALIESSDDEEGLKEPVRSRNESKDLPHVPKVSVTIQPHHTMVPAGFVSSVVGESLIVEGSEGQQPLSEGSIVWLTEQRVPLGIVDELFGPVKKPFYVVRYNDASEIPEDAKVGAKVSYVREFADFVLNHPNLYAKGYDNTVENDEELSDSEVYFSDDEKEAEYKRAKPRMKRGNSELRTPDIDTKQHQEKRMQGKRSSKDNRNQRSRGDNARTFQSNNDFPARPSRQQNPPFQRRQGERDLPFQQRPNDTETPYHYRQDEREPSFTNSGGGTMHKSHNRHFQNRSPGRQFRSQQSQRVSADAGVISKQQGQVSKKDQRHASPRPISQDVQPTHSNQSSESTSWEPQPPQTLVPQPQAWHTNQPLVSPNMASPQLPGVQHSQMPVCNAAVVVGAVSQVAGTLCGLPTTNNVPVQSGLPMHQPPVFHQVPLQQQFSSFGAHQFSPQMSPNMGVQMGNQVQAGYSMGVGPVAAFSAPVLGIPVGSAASTPSNCTAHNQQYSSFAPAAYAARAAHAAFNWDTCRLVAAAKLTSRWLLAEAISAETTVWEAPSQGSKSAVYVQVHLSRKYPFWFYFSLLLQDVMGLTKSVKYVGMEVYSLWLALLKSACWLLKENDLSGPQ
ncbi:hypothetical protein GOP47_0002898 [Adiantum capillus-veneris]|uniref:H/ACA ribonucleoprotein complex non-core subunit NAF1 n=1 Tax=Adiantum capillus-veneris TaxID=13818 RepID=A0A9D4ZS11_ADICA|nr:hypothetical protein GOP47_0002898 [Adiantum capillus-veneris]